MLGGNSFEICDWAGSKGGATQKAPGMEAFKKQHKPDKVLLVGNSGIPWQKFLKSSPAQLF